jgi:hypothetical protein
MIALLFITLMAIITMTSTIISSEASRYLAGTIVVHEIAKTSPILIAISIAIFFG